MNKTIKLIATVGLVILMFSSAMFYLMYQEYQYTFVREERVLEGSNLAKTELNNAIYTALKRETQTKVNMIADEIRSDLLTNYGNNISKFTEDYNYPTEDSILVTTIDKIIHSDNNRFYYVESDSNDMFVASKNGVISDKSQDCSVFGITRTYEQEISMHFNKKLAKQAINSMVLADKSDIFWRFKNTTPNKDIGLREMDIDKVLSLSLHEIKDYEFLSVTYIDRYGDILGVENVSLTGQQQDSKQLIVVQGFNLYEHIQEDFKLNYIHLEKNEQQQLELIKENRRGIVIKLVLMMTTTFISFFFIAVVQNNFVKGCGRDGSDN